MLVESIIEVTLLFARLALAVVFCMAGVAKLADLPGSRQAVKDFGVPRRLASLIGVGLPVLELAIAAAMLPVVSARWAAGAAALILLVFMAAMLSNMARGRRPDCGCFGQTWPDPVGWKTLLRNASLVVLAVYVALDPGSNLATPLAGVSAGQATGMAFAGALLGLVALQGWFIFRLLRQNGRLLLCLEAMEQNLEEDTPAVWYAANDSLPIGSPAPGFRLPDVEGETVSLDDLLGQGRMVMLAFISPGCKPCRSFLPDLAGWQRRMASELTIALVSQGSREDNQRLCGDSRMDNLLLQRGREVAEAYQVYGTPSAVLVGRQGELLSEVAAGEASIRRLLSAQVAEPLKAGFWR